MDKNFAYLQEVKSGRIWEVTKGMPSGAQILKLVDFDGREYINTIFADDLQKRIDDGIFIELVRK